MCLEVVFVDYSETLPQHAVAVSGSYGLRIILSNFGSTIQYRRRQDYGTIIEVVLGFVEGLRILCDTMGHAQKHMYTKCLVRVLGEHSAVESACKALSVAYNPCFCRVCCRNIVVRRKCVVSVCGLHRAGPLLSFME